MSGSQFCWRVIGSPQYPPPEPKRGPRHGPDADCWLCGGPTHGVGWPRATAIEPTFTNPNLAKSPTSTTVCQACCYLSHNEGWRRHTGETNQRLGWRNYAHLFTFDGHRRLETRADVRAVLLDPPEPPFVLCLPTSGQKQLLFRTQVAYDRASYPVQLEEETVLIEPGFGPALAMFEHLYALGFSREEITRGEYNTSRILRAGISVWRAAEAAFGFYRAQHPAWVRLCAHVAQRPEKGE